MDTSGPPLEVTADRFDRRFSRSAAQLAEMRRTVRSWFQSHGMPGAMVDDFELAVSELATNATQHGSGPDIELELMVTPTRYVAVVAAETATPRGIADVELWRIAPPESLNGRGLGIVAAVMDVVEFAADDGRAVFRCQRHR